MNLTVDMPWERDLSVNAYKFGKGGGYRRKPHVQAWMDRLQDECFYQFWTRWESKADYINLPVTVVVRFRFPDRRRRDDHNYYKVICDAVGAGLGVDDKDLRISTGSVTRGVGKEAAGFTIEVSDERS